jgi:hypothetical protein
MFFFSVIYLIIYLIAIGFASSMPEGYVWKGSNVIFLIKETILQLM